MVRQLLRAHEYWRMKQLAVDLVILNENPPSYAQDLQTALETMVRASQSHGHPGKEPGAERCSCLRAELLSPRRAALLQSVARAVIWTAAAASSNSSNAWKNPPRRAAAKSPATTQSPPRLPPPLPKLEFFNGLGGFAGGRQGICNHPRRRAVDAGAVDQRHRQPAFGFQVSAEGGGYTWSINSQQNQITPWSNDPVSDRPGEVFYVRDEDSGELWGPTALPIREETSPYVVRHGQGYSRFEHTSHGICARTFAVRTA